MSLLFHPPSLGLAYARNKVRLVGHGPAPYQRPQRGLKCAPSEALLFGISPKTGHHSGSHFGGETDGRSMSLRPRRKASFSKWKTELQGIDHAPVSPGIVRIFRDEPGHASVLGPVA